MFPKKLGASLFPMAVVFVVALMVIPVPTVVLDVLLACNLGLAILMLLASLNVSKALDLSAFPSLLLIATLFRLGLNVSTARLILSEGDAGQEGQPSGRRATPPRGRKLVGHGAKAYPKARRPTAPFTPARRRRTPNPRGGGAPRKNHVLRPTSARLS